MTSVTLTFHSFLPALLNGGGCVARATPDEQLALTDASMRGERIARGGARARALARVNRDAAA